MVGHVFSQACTKVEPSVSFQWKNCQNRVFAVATACTPDPADQKSGRQVVTDAIQMGATGLPGVRTRAEGAIMRRQTKISVRVYHGTGKGVGFLSRIESPEIGPIDRSGEGSVDPAWLGHLDAPNSSRCVLNGP